MDAIEAIRTRRMIPRVTAQRPSREEIEELLELAVRAPNHFLTNPWRFTVLTGHALERMARAIARDAAGEGDPEEHLDTARAKVSRAPVILVVSCHPSEDPRVFSQEELASCAMAVQNILLACHAKGLGAMLRTGSVAYSKAIHEELDLEGGETVVGFLYLGYPAADRQPTPREPASEKTRWLGWPDDGG